MAKAEIHVIPTDRNASLVGLDILRMLKDAGWDATGLTSDFTLNPELVGIMLVVNHRDFPEGVALQAALRNAGIQAGVEIDDTQKLVKDKNLILIAIGAKPPIR